MKSSISYNYTSKIKTQRISVAVYQTKSEKELVNRKINEKKILDMSHIETKRWRIWKKG